MALHAGCAGPLPHERKRREDEDHPVGVVVLVVGERPPRPADGDALRRHGVRRRRRRWDGRRLQPRRASLEGGAGGRDHQVPFTGCSSDPLPPSRGHRCYCPEFDNGECWWGRNRDDVDMETDVHRVAFGSSGAGAGRRDTSSWVVPGNDMAVRWNDVRGGCPTRLRRGMTGRPCWRRPCSSGRGLGRSSTGAGSG